MENYRSFSISPTQAKALIDAGAVLIDVRTAEERKLAYIPGSIHIPVVQLGERIGELPKGNIVITHCHHGVRSLFAAGMLRKHGIDAKSMEGGIEQWSREIDPKVPQY